MPFIDLNKIGSENPTRCPLHSSETIQQLSSVENMTPEQYENFVSGISDNFDAAPAIIGFNGPTINNGCLF